jgi:hypothetical protein
MNQRPSTLKAVAEQSESLADFGRHLRDWLHNLRLISSQPVPAAAIAGEPPRLHDKVERGEIARGSSESLFVDALPSGYFVQKRINLDRARVQGLKLTADWKPVKGFTLNASVLFNEPTIVRSSIAPQLAGKQVAQTSHSDDGLVNLGSPRLVLVGFRVRG